MHGRTLPISQHLHGGRAYLGLNLRRKSRIFIGDKLDVPARTIRFLQPTFVAAHLKHHHKQHSQVGFRQGCLEAIPIWCGGHRVNHPSAMLYN